MSLRSNLICCFATLTVLLSCQHTPKNEEQIRSAYYWSTTFSMSDVKKDFLLKHHIQRLYVRYFDVVPKGIDVKPNATIRFKDDVPAEVEIIPTVFILNDCFYQKNIPDLAKLIVERVLQMNETHDVTGVKEIQIDCDWTAKSEKAYFALLSEMREKLKDHDIRLSVTIRLHQLSSQVPPVDRGVLMMYNTGDFTQLDCQHPILDMKVAEPYLRHLPDYALPISCAYPLYRWELLFRGKTFVGIMHGDDLPTLPSDSIVVREPTLEEILQARQRISQIRPDANNETILFELNDYNITRFNSDDYEEIFAY